MGGAFQTSREIFQHPIWQDPVKFRIFFYIVGNAVFSNDGVKVGNTTLKRGQFLRSLRNLQDDLAYREGRGNSVKKYPLETIRRKIKSLENEERITTKNTEHGTLFTVVNYALYQSFDHYTKEEMGQKRDSNESGMGQGWDNNKKDKKDKKDNNKKPSCPKFEICDLEIAEYLFRKILDNNPQAKKPNLEVWASEVRLMREKDKRTIEQIQYLINWSQNDSFWKTNILSTSKLRSKFDQLVIRCKEERERSKQQRSNQKPKKEIDWEDL